ncbi:MAG: NADP-dependent isocitrate dehydrogenase [Planctomycetota bacterium]
MSDAQKTIVYTRTDEAPALATRSLLPLLRKITASSGIVFEEQDISLAARILAQFRDQPEFVDAQLHDQPITDALAELGQRVLRPDANIIKLPNISASIPQLTAAIKELRNAGYPLPDFPSDPQTDQERDIRARYAKALGSAVNPVLREGNSDRRVAGPVKSFAKSHPHSMGDWSADSKTRVAHMTDGDFYGNEQSVVIANDDTLRIEFVDADGHVQVLKDGISVQSGDVFDATCMDVCKLRSFLRDSIATAKADGVLLSVHLKATMMKVSDPILFGHVVQAVYEDVFSQHGEILQSIGAAANQGLGQILSQIESLPADQKSQLEAAFAKATEDGPDLAMVDSDRGITNLHVPSDIIIDASMPAAIRAGGKMWDQHGQTRDTLAIIPDRCYAGIYQAVIDDCKIHGAFDVSQMGSVSNVGLMAKKAEEYGSHDKTFEMPSAGQVRVVGQNSGELMTHAVGEGDIWRACQPKRVAIFDWVRLGVARSRATGSPAVFWLDSARAHDRNLIEIVQDSLKDHDTDGLQVEIMAPADATRHACDRARAGEDTISVTGNVLRDYLTDLFPILELGTSAKMLSIVPLLAGGGMFETGAGGSAPKHVQQFAAEGHLRWDSLGEFLALAVSLEAMAEKTGESSIDVLKDTLNSATETFLNENKSPSRKVGELDNRGSHFYLALYWAEALADQDQDARLKNEFTPISKTWRENESQIIAEIRDSEGSPIDLGGYYLPDEAKADAAMRPSPTLNQTLVEV